MPPNALQKVFNSIVFPHFTYCCTIWCNVNNQLHLDQFLKLQKKASRILLNVRDILTPTIFLFSCLSWMPIKDYFTFRQVIFLYKVLHNQMPAYFSVFRYTRDVNCRKTRSNDFMSNLLYLPRPKTENYRRSYSYSSAFLWNKRAQNIRNSTSVSNFKSVYLREYFQQS